MNNITFRWTVVIGAVSSTAAIIWVNYFKTAWSGIQGWGRPYWWLDYHHGFVRRGLVGEVFQSFLGRLDEAHLIGPVDLINRLICTALAAAMLWLIARAILAQRRAGQVALVGALGLWCAASQLWPTLAYTQGYLDSVVLLWALAAALTVQAGWTVVAGVLLFVGPFIHEYFVFLVPFVLASDPVLGRPQEVRRGLGELAAIDTVPEPILPRRLFILGAVAVIAAAIVTFGPSAAAARLEIGAMPLSTADKDMLSTTTLSQTVSQSFSASASQLFEHPAFTARNFAFFLLPAGLTVAAMLAWRRQIPTIRLWLRAAAAVFPVLALLIAWDLSRLLVMASLPAATLFLMTVAETPEPTNDEIGTGSNGPALALAGFLGLGALAYATAPMAYVYYEPGPATLFPLKAWPGDGYATWGVERLWGNAHNAGVLQKRPNEARQ